MHMASVLPKTDSPASSSAPSAVPSPPPPSDLEVLEVLEDVFFLDLDSFLYVSLFASREVLKTSLVVVFLDLDVDLHCFKESGVFQKLVEI